jgi:hypothetical protein
MMRLGLLDPAHRPQFNIAISRGSTVAADVTVGTGRFVHLKASTHVSLESEHSATLRASAIHGAAVPRPIAHVVEAGWELLLTEGRRFETLQPWTLNRRVALDLVEFLARAAVTASRPSPGRHGAFLVRCLAGASTPIARHALRSWLSGDRARQLDELAIVAQHGDFTANNIGITDPGVVVFDWADFGAVELPGFDLATLLLSLTGFDAGRAYAALDGAEEPVGNLIHAAGERLGLERHRFHDLLPLYLAVFLALKSDYAAGIRLKAAAALEQSMQLARRA